MNTAELTTIQKNGTHEKNNSEDLLKDYQPLFEPKVYLQPVHLYYSLNKKIPHRLIFDELDLDLLQAELLRQNLLLSQIVSENYYFSTERFRKRAWLAMVSRDIIIFHSRESNDTVIYYSDKSDKQTIENLKKIFIKCRKKIVTENVISLICTERNELSLNCFTIEPVNLDIEKNYNDDFKGVHEIILSRLNKENDKGLLLLHGKPGTGKTTYIRYLLATIKKEMIYVPPDLAATIASPGFLSFLMNHRNSVLIIEDAENVIEERGVEKNGAISNLLNLCDGLLSDCLKIQVLCTFNNDISSIDKALMRKGRLIAQYEFCPLEIIKAQSLSDSLGFQTKITHPMALAEIYNQNEKDFSKKEKQIGFKNM